MNKKQSVNSIIFFAMGILLEFFAVYYILYDFNLVMKKPIFFSTNSWDNLKLFSFFAIGGSVLIGLSMQHLNKNR